MASNSNNFLCCLPSKSAKLILWINLVYLILKLVYVLIAIDESFSKYFIIFYLITFGLFIFGVYKRIAGFVNQYIFLGLVYFFFRIIYQTIFSLIVLDFAIGFLKNLKIDAVKPEAGDYVSVILLVGIPLLDYIVQLILFIAFCRYGRRITKAPKEELPNSIRDFSNINKSENIEVTVVNKY